MFHAVIVGGGPVGLAAALQLRSAKHTVGLITLPATPLRQLEQVEDLFGLVPQTGEDLYATTIQSLKQAGVEVIPREVTGIVRVSGGFLVNTSAGEIAAKTVLLATGEEGEIVSPAFIDRSANIALRAEEAGFRCRGRMVGVYGRGDYAVAQLRILQKKARAVTLFTDGDIPLHYDHSISVNRYPIARLCGTKMEFANHTALNVDILFLAHRIATATDLIAGVGLKNLAIDSRGQTECAGLYAAGDCVGKYSHLQERVYAGFCVGRSMADALL